jgi:hypothetical protein
MRQFTITMSGNTCDFSTLFSQPIILNPNKEYEAAFVSLETYNSIPNITDKNNKFVYSVDNGVNWKTIVLEPNAYEITQINAEIQRQMVINNDYDITNNLFFINISHFTLSTVVEITNPNYKINFDVENSIGTTLGFEREILSVGYNKSSRIVDIMNVNSIMVNVDFIHGSYVDGERRQTIHSFFPNVRPGYKIRERPQPELMFYPVNSHYINHVRVWLTDQDNNLIDLQGERVTIRIVIREVK